MKLLLLLTLLALVASDGGETYPGVEIDTSGKIKITTASGKVIVPPRDAGQAGAEAAAVSPDGQSVGWLALYPYCCTSYPAPLKLMIFRHGRARPLINEAAPIFRWAFLDDGKHVAFMSSTLHGAEAEFCELRDTATRRRLARWTRWFEGPHARDPAPGWVRELDSKTTPLKH